MVGVGKSTIWSGECLPDSRRPRPEPAICRIAQRDPRVRGVRLAGSFGQRAAILAGLKHARGEAVVTMDADLQHPPR